MSRKKYPAGAMDGPAGVKKVAGTGTEQTRYHSRHQRVVSNYDAECDAIPADRIESLTRAVILVAGTNLAEAERAAVLARVIADLIQSDHADSGTVEQGGERDSGSGVNCGADRPE